MVGEVRTGISWEVKLLLESGLEVSEEQVVWLNREMNEERVNGWVMERVTENVSGQVMRLASERGGRSG